MLIRKHFAVPAGSAVLHLDGTVDNNAHVYINGTLIQAADSGNCQAGAINVDIPGSLLTSDNVIAIRGSDLGVEDYLDVQLSAIQNEMSTGPKAVVVPAVAILNTKDDITLDLTKDGKDPFCGPCRAGWASPFAYSYYPKPTRFALKLHDSTTGRHCDSTQPKASSVALIQPSGSAVIGYQVSFNPNCGATGSPGTPGVVADLFIMDSSAAHDYMADPGGGYQGTDHVAHTFQDLAKLNGVTCILGKALKAVNKLLEIRDYTQLSKAVESGEFKKKLAEIGAEKFQDLGTKPVAGTTSCAARRIFAQAAIAVNAEAIAAHHEGTTLGLNDQIAFHGKHSNYQLYIADPAGIGLPGMSTFPIVNVTTDEQGSMGVRALLAGLSRTSPEN